MAHKARAATYDDLTQLAGALKMVKVELQETLLAISGKLDRLVAAADRTAGELLDNRQSHIVFGAMFGDHRRTLESHEQRLGALERRPFGP